MVSFWRHEPESAEESNGKCFRQFVIENPVYGMCDKANMPNELEKLYPHVVLHLSECGKNLYFFNKSFVQNESVADFELYLSIIDLKKASDNF